MSVMRTTNVDLAEESSLRSGLLAATTAAVRKNTLTIIPSREPIKRTRIAKLVAKLRLNRKTL